MNVRGFGTLGALGLLCVALWIATPHFATTANLVNVLEQSAIVGTVAVGMTFVILTGGIDLSVGSIVALAGIAFGVAFRATNAASLAFGAALLTGAACGAANGALVTLGRLPSFIVTLGTMSVARGIALMWSDGRPISGFPSSVRALAGTTPLGVPTAVVVMLSLYAIGHVALRRTVFGRYVYAIGGNAEAARLSGVRVERYRRLVYVLSGVASAITALLLVARLDSAQPIAGMSYELDAIAAVVVGGTSLQGGVGSAGGTLVGALIMSVLRNGLNLLGVSAYVQQVAFGVVIVAAVLLDTTLRGRSRGTLEPAL